MDGKNQAELKDKDEVELELFIGQRFAELHNLIVKSREFAKPLADKSFFESLEFVDREMWKKIDRIINALREFNSKR